MSLLQDLTVTITSERPDTEIDIIPDENEMSGINVQTFVDQQVGHTFYFLDYISLIHSGLETYVWFFMHNQHPELMRHDITLGSSMVTWKAFVPIYWHYF